MKKILNQNMNQKKVNIQMMGPKNQLRKEIQKRKL